MLKHSLQLISLLTLAVAILPPPLAAQEKPADPSLPIALLNVEKIAQQHKPFQKKVAALQEQAKEMQASAVLKQSELETVRGELQRAAPSSQEAKKLQEQYVRLQRELQTFVQEGQQKVRDKELKLNLSLHREIEQVLKPYCKSKGLRLVIRTQNSSLDENLNPQQILQAINRGVLYEEGLDITADVLKLLGEQSEKDKP